MSHANEILLVDDANIPELDLRGDEFQQTPLNVLAEALSRGPVAKSKRGYEFLSYALISEAFLNESLDTAGPEHYEKLGAGESVLWFVNNGLLSTMSRMRHDPHSSADAQSLLVPEHRRSAVCREGAGRGNARRLDR
jgi:hypothetical protein